MTVVWLQSYSEYDEGLGLPYFLEDFLVCVCVCVFVCVRACVRAVLPAIPFLNDAANFPRTLVRVRRRRQLVSVVRGQLALAAQ